MIEISVCAILDAYNGETRKDNYKLTPEQVSFENFVLNVLKQNVTNTGNLTLAGLFHLADRLEDHTWRQKNIVPDKLNSFEFRINKLIHAVGFDILLVAHQLKSNKKFTEINFNHDTAKAEIVRIAYEHTIKVFTATTLRITTAINAMLEKISSEIEETKSKLNEIDKATFFNDSIYNSEFIEITLKTTKQIISEENNLKELCDILKKISYKLKLYHKKLDALNVQIKPYRFYVFKQYYSKIDDICNTILSEEKLIGDDAAILNVARTNFMGIFTSMFERIEYSSDSVLEAMPSAPVNVNEPKNLFLSLTSNVANSSSFFQDTNEPAVTLPNNGEFTEMELSSISKPS
jgi:hypothetical protein